jgi:hypothetical protein
MTPEEGVEVRKRATSAKTGPQPRLRREMEDNQSVRRLLAAAIVVLFATLNAVDGICCADGCTHEGASTSPHSDRQSSYGSCVLCLGSLEPAAPQAASASGIVMDRCTLHPLARLLDAPTEPPDHPPRS